MSLPQPSRDPRTPRLSVLPSLAPRRSVPSAAWHALLGSVQQWAVESQRTARRNAMVAGTALAQRRAEREDVEQFLAARDGRSDAPTQQPGDAGAPGRSAQG